ncbi:uncharacterized protein F5891DRAFT_987044 [Suillus fuscotomentosus]|uniref:Uncharacterized protein n=1 Tax=Suillus fuscotomentosus TaxID=1912939 RepID=A0AAD4DR27_9AGAM|nr:uncharacterized protein F5891DRAFT_987044 [Suillus fuscotomentosus]KAG1890511.1 hypothetical protein F5891DRAFT_987044 [Suillus fuscotomentosus]
MTTATHYCLLSHGLGRRLRLRKIEAWAKALVRPCPRPGLGLAESGPAWPGPGLEAEPEHHYPDPVYAPERGPVYSRRYDVDERQHLPPYDDHPAATRGYHDWYNQRRMYQESRWIDHDEGFPGYSREAPPPRSLSPNIPPMAPPSS